LASQAGSYVAGNSIAGSQIEIVDQMQLKVNELCMKIDELERELNLKNGAVDRELNLNSLNCRRFSFWGDFVKAMSRGGKESKESFW
jgi:hypothetical protein